MILTCPECATSYFVDDDRIPPGGRKVKCANCGARWMASLDPPPTSLDPDEISPELADLIAPEAVAEPAHEPDAVYDDVDVAPDEAQASEPPLTVEPETALSPRPPAARAPARKGLSGGLIALMALAVLSLAAAAVVVLRGPIARAAPATAPVFEALGMKAKTTDLAIEGVHSQAAFQGDTPVLSVTGAVRNSGAEAQAAPPIRVRLKDRAGKIVAQRTATPVDAAVPAGATRYFAIIVPNPPATAGGLEVDFTAEPVKSDAPSKAEPAHH